MLSIMLSKNCVNSVPDEWVRSLNHYNTRRAYGCAYSCAVAGVRLCGCMRTVVRLQAYGCAIAGVRLYGCRRTVARLPTKLVELLTKLLFC